MFLRNAKTAIAAALLVGATATSALAQSEVPRQKFFPSGRTVGRDAMPRGNTPGVVGGVTGGEVGGGSAGGVGGAGGTGGGAAGGGAAAGAGGANGGGSAGGGPGR